MDFSISKVIADAYGPMTTETYDQVSQSLFWAYDLSLKSLAVEAAWRPTHVNPNMKEIRMLDLGVGTGNASLAVLREFEKVEKLTGHKPALSLTCIDASPHMLSAAKTKLAEFKLDKLQMLISTFEDLQLKGDSYDLIYSSFAIHHLVGAKKLDLFFRINSALTNDGVFVIADRMLGDSAFDDQMNMKAIISPFVDKVPMGVSVVQLENEIQRQFELDQDSPSTLSSHKNWLSESRFENIRNPFHSFCCAVFSGTKTPGPKYLVP